MTSEIGHATAEKIGVKAPFSAIPRPPEGAMAGPGARAFRVAPNEASLQQVSLRPPGQVDTVEMVRLYQSIEQKIGRQPHGIVQIVSPGGVSGNGETAYQLAWVGAVLLGRRILFVDASQESGSRRPAPVPLPSQKRLSEVAAGSAVVEEAIVKEMDCGLFVATLYPDGGGRSSLPGRDICGLLEDLRPAFDMILIAPAPVLDQPLATILSSVADGSVVVLQSGTSRHHAVRRAMESLVTGGAPILGVVLTRQRNYVPKWLRRWFSPS